MSTLRLLPVDTLKKVEIDNFLQNESKYLLISSAGCGTRIKEYNHLFNKNSSYYNKALLLKEKTMDIYEFLYIN